MIEVAQRGKEYCSGHFKSYFIGKVGEVLDEYNVEGKVAVALSGGKDSSTCLEVLTHFDRLDLSPFFIDLGIGEYSSKSLGSAKEVSNELGLSLDVIDLEELYGKSIPELNEEEGGKPCALCGTVKRYLMNKHAWENGSDYVVTGHTLSDEVSSTFNNLANVYLTPFRGLKPVLREDEDYRLSARVKPLYFLKDEECSVYANEFDVPFCSVECPFTRGSPTDELKEWLHRLDSNRPGILENFAKSFIRIEERMEREKVELDRCENCGYPTSTGTCKFCRIMGRAS